MLLLFFNDSVRPRCPSISCLNGGIRVCAGSRAYCRCRSGFNGNRCQSGKKNKKLFLEDCSPILKIFNAIVYVNINLIALDT